MLRASPERIKTQKEHSQCLHLGAIGTGLDFWVLDLRAKDHKEGDHA